MNALRAFDGAARHLNLSLAAEELRVSHSAVSQQIRQLETWLGGKLFERHSGGVRLTAAGQDLLRAVRPAFDMLEQRCVELRGRTASADVVVGAPASLLSNWIIPRLERFERAHPRIQVRLQTATDIALLERRVVDVLIVAEDHASATIGALPLFPEAIGPVCTRELAQGIATPADILALALLQTSSRPRAWEQWASACGLPAACSPPKHQFDQLGHMLDAAAVGLGIGIAPEMLVQADLRAGRLVAPLGFKETGGWFSLYCRADATAAVEGLKHWLKTEAVSQAAGPP
ncbi:LysR substrate-binding domain-containing protein [Achromobacter sp. Bel]|uniref:LysR substrate-binding domain-containing protein n=1 Tax=Achromobacter sp. Bel TaxID=2727415 RepID=UPI00145E0E56|nr:LysR substrate-binding domain-containing protein [Achromobacter sp. Bel]NMK49269.1 LysR family transcriptional regulator [Achromobacter sp. Bel]